MKVPQYEELEVRVRALLTDGHVEVLFRCEGFGSAGIAGLGSEQLLCEETGGGVGHVGP